MNYRQREGRQGRYGGTSAGPGFSFLSSLTLCYTGFGGREKRAADAKFITSGRALQRHIDTQHSGKVDSNCNACKELKSKIVGG